MAGVERPRHVTGVEPLGRADRPRQGERQLGPLNLSLGPVGTGPEHPRQPLRDRLPDVARQAGGVEAAGDRAVDAGPAADQGKPHGVDPRRDGGARGRPRPDRGRAGRKQTRRGPGPAGGLLEEVERPRLVHDGAAAGDRQVGQLPQMALRGRGDHVRRPGRAGPRGGGVGVLLLRRGFGTAEGAEGPPVLFERRRIHQQHRRALRALQELRTHDCLFTRHRHRRDSARPDGRASTGCPDHIPTAGRSPRPRQRKNEDRRDRRESARETARHNAGLRCGRLDHGSF